MAGMTDEQLSNAAAELCRMRGVPVTFNEGHHFAAMQEIRHYHQILQAINGALSGS
jgi:hypothetical protein